MRPFAEMTSKWFDLLSILISFWTNGKASITWLHTSDALLTRSCCNGSIRYALSNSLLSSPFSSDVIPRRLISFNNNKKNKVDVEHKKGSKSQTNKKINNNSNENVKQSIKYNQLLISRSGFPFHNAVKALQRIACLYWTSLVIIDRIP